MQKLTSEEIDFIKEAPDNTTHINLSYPLYWDLSTKVPYLWHEDNQTWEYENLNLEPQTNLRHIDDLRYLAGL
tara:strand:+ start:448 stop:666 length:219 start_codon:yes stop_codon:yes gene_type:complete